MIRPQKLWLGVLALAMILVLTSPAFADEAKGVLTSIDQDNYQFVLTDQEGAEWQFSLLLTGQVLVNGDERDISDLRPGDNATITFELDEERMVATHIIATREEVRGILTSIDQDNYQFVMTDQEGTEWQFSLLLTGQVLVNGEERDISDLRPGDNATITFQLDEERMVATHIIATREVVAQR